MFDGINSAEEFYGSESTRDYYSRKLQEYQELLKIKKGITEYRKYNLNDILDCQKRKYICYQKCYKKPNLRDCIPKCKAEVIDMKQFLDNIQKFVYHKNVSCHKGCESSQKESSVFEEQISLQINKLKCLWVCENKIDRRYKDYWMTQRNDIIDRHSKRIIL